MFPAPTNPPGTLVLPSEFPGDVHDVQLRPWWQSSPVIDELDGDDPLTAPVGTHATWTDPAAMLARVRQYFDYVITNHFVTEKIQTVGKQVARVPEYKRRTPSLSGLCVFLGIDNSNTWARYKSLNNGLGRVCRWAYQILYEEKTMLANAGLANPILVARMLGISDKVETETKDVTPPEAPKQIDQRMIANLIHPDDPDPLGDNRPLYSALQIEQGTPFHDPNSD